jgi:hypothetical protein
MQQNVLHSGPYKPVYNKGKCQQSIKYDKEGSGKVNILGQQKIKCKYKYMQNNTPPGGPINTLEFPCTV